MILDALTGHIQDLFGDEVHIEAVVGVVEDLAPLRGVLQTHDDGVHLLGDAAGPQVLFRQTGGAGGDDAHGPVTTHQSLCKGHLQQRGGEHRDLHGVGQCLLEDSVEAAAGGDSPNALLLQLLGQLNHVLQQLLAGMQDHGVGVGALHLHQLHREGVGCRIGAVAGQLFQLHEALRHMAGFPAENCDLFHNIPPVGL